MDSHKIGLNENDNKLSLDGYEFSLENLVQQIMDYKDRSNVNLFTKMNSDYIVGLMEKESLQDLEKSFIDQGKKKIGIVQFIKTFLSITNHKEEETIFLTLGLIDFFKGICESLNMVQEIKFSDITTTICDRVATQFEDEYKIQTRNYPPQRMFTNQVEGKDKQIKKIDFKAPIVFENNQHNSLRRLHKGKFQTDSTYHNNHQIKKAVFAKQIKKVITLDSLDDKLAIYDLNCNLLSYINLKSKEDDSKLDIIIFGMVWSEKQQRIGAVLKNFTISFWDAINDFKFEKNFSVHGYTQDYQTNIWYLEKHDMWITTDIKNALYSWDIAEEKTYFTLTTPSISGAIFQVLELPQTDLCAVGSLDKKVSIWNFQIQILMFQIEIGQVGVHSIAFSNAFQVLITAGYENNISLYTIDSEYLDSTLIGKLRGHNSMINCIQVIEQTPIVVSADDQGIVRLWDIRNQTCIQSYECSSSQSLANTFTKRINIQLILDMFSEGMIALIGSRINLINFDEKDEIIKSFNQVENQFPIKVENNTIRDELIVCTRKEVKFFDMNTGLCKFTVNGLMENKQDEITVFKQVQQGQKFLLGNQKGQISIHSYQQNGKRIKFLNNHTNEITQLKIDYVNKLLVSGGWDSSIKIQKLTDENVEMKRKIENVHFEKGVSLLEVSVYHNVIFSATQNTERVYIYDYEYGKLLNYIEFKDKTEPTALCSISGYPILIVATSENLIYFIYFTKKDSKISFEFLGVINVYQSEQLFNKINFNSSHDPELFITKLGEGDEEEEEEIQNQQQSTFLNIKIDEQLSKSSKDKLLSIPINPSSNKQTQFTNRTQTHNNQSQLEIPTGTYGRFSEQFDKVNITDHLSGEVAASIDKNNKAKTKSMLVEVEKEASVYISKILPEFSFNDKNEIETAKIYCANTKGFITDFDLIQIFKHYDGLQYQPHSNTRMNYNPHRNSTEDFTISMTKFSGLPQKFTENTPLSAQFRKENKSEQNNINKVINKLIKNRVQAHSEQITSIGFVSGDNQRIITSSQDYYVRIWDKHKLLQICSLNINHPLPIQWQYKCNYNQKSQKKVLFALRILDMINKKYDNEISRKQEGSTKIISFIKKLMGIKSLYVQQEQKQINQEQFNLNKVNELDENLIETFKNEEQESHKTENQNQLVMPLYYSPRDIKYNEIKEFYKNELLGPSLKRMEINKRVAIAQQLWKKPKLTKEEQEREQAKKMLQFHVKSDERETIINFLDPEYRNQIIKKGYLFEDDQSKYTQHLQNKLEIYEFNAKKANTKFRTQNSGASVQYSSMNKLLVPQSGKRQTTQSFQQQQTNQNSNPSIMTEISSPEQKFFPMPSSTQHIEFQRRKSIHSKTNQQQKSQNYKSSKGQKSQQTLTLQLDTIKDISQNGSHTKLSQTQIQLVSPQVKEPNNFDLLFQKGILSPKVVRQKISVFPDSQDTKIRVDAFPQTAAKLQQMYQINSGCIDSRQYTNTTTSPYNKSGFGIELDYKNKKTQDVYKYAQEKQIIGKSSISSQVDSVFTVGSNASQIVSASSNKLHSILNGINSKLLKFKRIGNSSNISLPVREKTVIDQTRTYINYDIMQQTQKDAFSEVSSSRNVQPSRQLEQSKKQILGSNNSMSSSGFLNSIYQNGNDLKNLGNISKQYNQEMQNDSNNQYFSIDKFHKNRNSFPSIMFKTNKNAQ